MKKMLNIGIIVTFCVSSIYWGFSHNLALACDFILASVLLRFAYELHCFKKDLLVFRQKYDVASDIRRVVEVEPFTTGKTRTVRERKVSHHALREVQVTR